MAEIILPPEEETPQTPELNIDKPTTNSKVITIEFEAKKTNKVSTKDTNQQLYTTDTDAWFEFKETSLEGANGTYSVVFRNRHDGSIFQRTGDVVNGVAYYKIPHQEIRHAGAWRGQVVYTLSNGDTTAREFDYDVKGHILDGKDVREIVVEDFETLMSQLRSMKDNAELELAGLVNTANQNETDRQAFFNDLVEDIDDLQANYQELLDTGVLQTNINTKLEALEEEYAPKLTEVTAQLAQKANDVEVRKKTTPISLNDFDGETLGIIQNGSGGTPINIESTPRPRSVTPETTTFFIVRKNKFDNKKIVMGEMVNHLTGALIENQSYWRTETFIVVEPNQTYSLSPFAISSSRVAFYSEQNVTSFVSGTTSESTFTVPNNARYLMFSTNRSPDVIQLEKNATPTVYEPYEYKPVFETVFSNSITSDKIYSKSIEYHHAAFIKESRNLFTKEDARFGGYPTDSTWIKDDNYNTSKAISVKPNTQYVFSQEVIRYALQDPRGNVIKVGSTNAENRIIETSDNTTHLLLSMTVGRWNSNDLQLEEGAESTPYVPYSKKLSPEIEVEVKNNGSKLSNKHILFIGDSNTHVNTWPQEIGVRTGAITYNGGMGATRLLDQSKPDDTYLYNFLNGCAVADALATGDFSELDYYGGLLDASISNSNPDYLDQIKNIKDAYADIENLDSIVISYGTNDVNNLASALGDEDSFDRTTWCGAINYVIKTISEVYPHIKIYFATPPFRAKMSGTVDTTSDDGVTGRLYMPEMAEKMIKITRANHLPCLDLYFKSGINRYTASRYLGDLSIDGTHYNAHGEEHISWLYQKFLENS